MIDRCLTNLEGSGDEAPDISFPPARRCASAVLASMTDRMLVLNCLAGDEHAWEALVKCYSRLVLNISWRFTGRRDLAEDLTQEVFLRAYRNLYRFRLEEASFRTWLCRLSRNLLIDYHRREKRHSLCSGGENLEQLSIRDDRVPWAQRVLEQAEAARFLEEGLQSLPAQLREAITLRDLEGMSYREIALTVGTPEGTIKSRVSRARLQLEKLLARRRATRARPVEGKRPLELSYA